MTLINVPTRTKTRELPVSAQGYSLGLPTLNIVGAVQRDDIRSVE